MRRLSIRPPEPRQPSMAVVVVLSIAIGAIGGPALIYLAGRIMEALS